MNELATITPPQPPVYPNHHGALPAQAPSLRDLLTILRRRKAIAIQAFIIVVALGVVTTLITKPTYRSTARILVESASPVMTINNNTNPLSNLFLPAVGHQTETQVEILRSSAVADKATKESQVPPGAAFLEVRRVADTDVIELGTVSNSPDAAYKYLNAVPTVYLRDIRSDRMREVSVALEFAQKRLKEENAQLKANELALLKFKQRSNVVDPVAQQTGALAVATEARTALSQAEAQADTLQAQLAAIVATRRSLSAQIANPTTTTNTAEIQSLRQRLDELVSQRKQALFLYKESDDEIRKIDRQISDLRGRLNRTPREVTSVSRVANPAVAEYDAKIADTRASLQAAQANVTSLRNRSSALIAELKRYNPLEREQGQLQRDIANRVGTVTSLTQSVEELSLRKKALEAANDPITVLQAASSPYKISPNIRRNITLAIVLGLLLACGAALLQESLDDHMRDEEEVRRMLAVPILGHFPLMGEGHSALPAIFRASQKSALQSGSEESLDPPLPDTLGSPEDVPVIGLDIGNGYSRNGYAVGSDRNLLEKFRVLRSNVQFTLVNRSHSTLLVTSSVPQEGKSYTTSNLASVMALDGRRVILVDADLHRPTQHQVFDLPLQPGLTNVLAGQAQLEDCLHETGVNGLRILTGGAIPPNPVELLNSSVMEGLLETLKSQCDILIFDSPPLLATADAQVMSSKVDGVLYVMQLGRVSKSGVARSFELLAQARANVIGIVLNKIDDQTRQNSYYGGYYGEYYGRSGQNRDDDISESSPRATVESDR
jgi:capsular exopolysaccharide synthesis family protein